MKKSIFTRIRLVLLTCLLVVSLTACTVVPNGSTNTTMPTQPSESIVPSKPAHTLLPPVTPNRVTYKTTSSQVVRRDLTIKAGIGETVIISQLTDIHLSYYNEEDLKDPVLKEAYELFDWRKDNANLENFQRTLSAAAKDSDLIVVTGDLYNYYSQGNMETLKEHLFDKYSNAIATLGNHDVDRQPNDCTLEDPVSYDELRATIAAGWGNDITYVSQIIKDKVMVIALDNGSFHFLPEQVPLLTADLQRARENGYVVLLFYHLPLLTGDAADNKTYADSKYSSKSPNFAAKLGSNPNSEFIGPHSTGTDKEIYDLITNNGDIIYGAFCGHIHGDFYTEIHAKTAAGEEIMIPQYLIQSVAYDKGHYLKITIE
jgi:hypothetical protein